MAVHFTSFRYQSPHQYLMFRFHPHPSPTTYQARHMERILEAIAQRVVTTNLNELAMRRSYSVELRRKTKQSKLESTAEGEYMGWTPACAFSATRECSVDCMHTIVHGMKYNSEILTSPLVTAVSGLPQEAIEKFVKNTTTTTASWGYNANQVVCTDLSVNSSSSSSSTSVAGDCCIPGIP